MILFVYFLTVPDVLAIVYATRSVHSQENEQAVNNAVKWHRETSDSKRPFRMNPPTLPILSSDIKEDASPIAKHRHTSSDSLKHNFLRIRQHSQMNGCFIAVLSREVSHLENLIVQASWNFPFFCSFSS